MRKEASREWGEFTKAAMELVGLTQTELAATLSKKLGKVITQGALQARINGPSSQPPVDPELSAWADALKLDGFHRQKFMRLALFSRTPPQVRKELLTLEDRLTSTENRLKVAEKRNSDLRAELVEVRAVLAQATAKCAELLARVRDIQD